MSNLLKAVLQTRDDFCKEFLDLDLYPYQKKYISDPLIESVLGGMGRRIYAEFPRQSGKTSSAAATALFMAASWREITGEPVKIGWFAPTLRTTKIWFDSVKNYLTLAQLKGLGLDVGERNSTTLELEGSKIMALTAGEGSNTKGQTFHLIGTDETADILDEKLEYDIKYMGAATNATYLHVGTPSYKMANRRFFEAVSRGGPQVYVLPFQEACQANPSYAKYVASQDQESDDFKMMIGMQWILEKSFFTTSEKLWSCRNEQRRTFDCTEETCYAAIDWAKDIDSTVVTIFRRKAGGVEILNWLELQTTDYSDQLGIINEFLGHYKNMHLVICDSTGTQDQIVDMLRNVTRYTVKGIKFTPQSKHDMFIAFQEAINRGWFEYPSEDCREVKRFEKQMLELVREYKGNYLACHSPEDGKSHDDFPVSAAMGVWAMLKHQPIPTFGGLA